MTVLASTRVFHKTKKLFLDFVIFDILFVAVSHILDTCRSQGLILDEKTNLFNLFSCK